MKQSYDDYMHDQQSREDSEHERELEQKREFAIGRIDYLQDMIENLQDQINGYQEEIYELRNDL